MNEEELRDVQMPGYPAAVRAGVGTIMLSYSSWNGVKCSAASFDLTYPRDGE